ncbi:hypothetical protein AALA79_12170 [Lachnospiraceae bacterium 64-25]
MSRDGTGGRRGISGGQAGQYVGQAADQAQGSAYHIVSSLCEKSVISLTEC